MNFDVETINKLLSSDNFKERLAGELLELTIRIQNLEKFLNDYKEDMQDFVHEADRDEPVFGIAVGLVIDLDPNGVRKDQGGVDKEYSMLSVVLYALVIIPFEPQF